MNIMFCGHRQVHQTEKVEIWLEQIVSALLEKPEKKIFYVGGYGEFDRLAAAVLREKKKRFTDLEIILVLPYPDRRTDVSGYDAAVYPPLEKVPPRFAILRRNEWMVEHSDLVIAYVLHGWGGAARTLEYAKRKKKRIIPYLERE